MQGIGCPVPLDPSADEVARMAAIASEIITRYYAGLRRRRISPDLSARDVRAPLEEPLPRSGVDFETVAGLFESVVLEHSRHNGHPRFFGYVASPGTAVATFAELLIAALNANVTSWRSAPAPTDLERIVLRWIKEMVGFPASAEGLFVSGGSLANFSAIAAARSAKSPVNVAARGMRALGQRMCLYVSEESHQSNAKAASLLGIGAENVRTVATDSRLRMDMADLVQRIQADLAAGNLPFCIVANAGSVNTGSVDPMEELVRICRRFDLWLHVDGAYGGFAVLSATGKRLFTGLSEADSITLDPHKWLYLPVGSGCVLYRDPAAARAAFGHDAEYMRVFQREPDEAYAFWNYGPELSRRFRALGVWMLMKCVGADAIAGAMEQNMACARYLERLVLESSDFEMLAPVELSIACFRYRPPEWREPASGETPEDLNRALDDLNERLMLELQRGGDAYVSNTRVRGSFALRACVLNYRTSPRDMEILLEDLRTIARQLQYPVEQPTSAE